MRIKTIYIQRAIPFTLGIGYLILTSYNPLNKSIRTPILLSVALLATYFVKKESVKLLLVNIIIALLWLYYLYLAPVRLYY